MGKDFEDKNFMFSDKIGKEALSNEETPTPKDREGVFEEMPFKEHKKATNTENPEQKENKPLNDFWQSVRQNNLEE